MVYKGFVKKKEVLNEEKKNFLKCGLRQKGFFGFQ